MVKSLCAIEKGKHFCNKFSFNENDLNETSPEGFVHRAGLSLCSFSGNAGEKNFRKIELFEKNPEFWGKFLSF